MTRAANPETPLAARLKQRIAETGPMPVAEYMAACLGDEVHGYYRTRDPLGARGDFITAPEVSQVFGELIGLWCILVWRGMNRPASFNLVELGPGRGTLMADAMRAASIDPDFIKAVRMELVDFSPVLRNAQKQLLGKYFPNWHDSVDDVAEGPAIFIANEFLDSLPVRQLVRDGGRWRERCVTAENGRLGFCLAEGDAAAGIRLPEAVARGASDGDVVELRPDADTMAAALGRRATQHPLAALFIDYGHARSAAGDTLQAMVAHGYADPLDFPGEQDLTAHVDFEAFARAAEAAGLACDGPVGQGEFLLKLGLAERCERLMKGASDAQRADIESGARRLADPAQMGALFKVLCVRSRDVATSPPFRE